MTSPAEKARTWHLHAERDLGFAKLGIEMGFYSQTCFMVHQSVEKGLKALLFLRGHRVIPDSFMVDLLKRVADVSPALNRFDELAADLDKYYTTARNPDVAPQGSSFQLVDEVAATYVVNEAEQLMLEIRNIIRFAR